jgi:hypothetical protein
MSIDGQRFNLYAGDYSICIEKFRRGQNDATSARAAGRAMGVARQAGGVRVRTGTGKVLPYTNYGNLLPF